jgi:hypothetical protein
VKGRWPSGRGSPTGVFFASQDAGSLAGAVRFFEEHTGEFQPAAIRQAVLPFDRPRFREQLSDFIERERSRAAGEPVFGKKPGGIIRPA